MSANEKTALSTSPCKALPEYVNEPTIDLGRILATTRTLVASWGLVAAFTVAMLLAPALTHGTRYAEVHAQQPVEAAIGSGLTPGHLLCALFAKHPSKAG
jgi:hypothetical protein